MSDTFDLGKLLLTDEKLAELEKSASEEDNNPCGCR